MPVTNTELGPVGRLAHMQPNALVQLKKTLTGSAKVTSDPKEPSGRFLVGVQVTRQGVVSTSCVAGIYVRVSEVYNNLASEEDRSRVVWAGYIRDGCTPASIPNLRAKNRTTFKFEAWALAAYDTEVVTVNLTFDDVPSGGTYVHNEAPGSGSGQISVVSMGNPAAGAEFATITVPTFERWRPLALRALLVTDANVANRRWFIDYDDGANAYARHGDNVNHTAGASITHSAAIGAPLQTVGVQNPAQFPLPDVRLPPGHRISFASNSLQAGDDWGAGTMLVEKWVMT